MAFKKEAEYLHGIITIVPDVYSDNRGFFMETFHSEIFSSLGLPSEFRQINHSGSYRNTIRGLHFQWDAPMGKLLRVVKGAAQIVEVDIRHDSPTLGKHCNLHASSDDRRIIWIPPGFANGFAALSEWTEIEYLCTATYNYAGESGILWNDPALNIHWEVTQPILSEKDNNAQLLSEWLVKPESQSLRLQE